MTTIKRKTLVFATVVLSLISSGSALVRDLDENLGLFAEQIPLNKILVDGNETNETTSYENALKNDPQSYYTSIERFPFMVSLQIVDDSGNRYHICSAALRATNKAITSAKCVENFDKYDHYVAVGQRALSGEGEIIKVKKVKVNSKYENSKNKAGFKYDVAELIFEDHVILGDKVQVGRLLTRAEDPHKVQSETCASVAWQRSPAGKAELRYIVHYRFSNYLCSLFWRIFNPPAIYWFHTCWGYMQDLYGVEYGDSGGILVCVREGDYVVTGIASYRGDRTGCLPVIFSRVSVFFKQ